MKKMCCFKLPYRLACLGLAFIILSQDNCYAQMSMFPANTQAPPPTANQQTLNQTETQQNQILLDNSTKSREYIEKINANVPVQEIRSIDNKPLPTSQLNLTDQEKQLSENYIHQGIANDIIKEKCGGKMSMVCEGQTGNHKFLGMDPAFMKVLGQAYVMIGAMSNDFLPINKGGRALGKDNPESPETQKTADNANKEGDTNKEKDSEAKKESSNDKNNKKQEQAQDYCKYIPTLSEGVAATVQAAKAFELSSSIGNGDTAQKDYLLKAAKSHDSRAKMAQVQAIGWWGGAACYGANAMAGQFAVDRNLAIKLGAASLLGFFYQNEVSANKEYAKKTREIANSLPGKGDCNPITDSLCYCSQPTTENDPIYCLKGLHAKKIAPTSYRIACTDDHLKLDPTCKCEASNSCFDRILENAGASTLQIGFGNGNSPFSPVRSLARGELVGGILAPTAQENLAAIARKALRELASKLPKENLNLNANEKSMISQMVSRGIPANVAAMIAKTPVNSSDLNAAIGKISGNASGTDLLNTTGSGPKSNNNIVEFYNSGSGLGTKGKDNKQQTQGMPSELLNQLKGQNKNASMNNGKILEFVKRAEENANSSNQIRQNDTPLFDIISLRYQISGIKKLQLEK